MSDKMFASNLPIFEENETNSKEIQDLIQAKESLELYRNKYNKLKKLHNALEISIQSNKLDNDLKHKLENILLSEQCAEFLHIDSESCSLEGTTLLGIPALKQIDLTYTEKANLCKAIEATLLEEDKKLSSEFFDITDKNIEDLPNYNSLNLQMKQDDQAIFDFKQQLSTQQSIYLENLQKQHELLEKFVKYRTEEIPKTLDQKLIENEIITRMNELRIEIVETKSRIDIFTDTKNSLAAYKIALDEIKTQQMKYRRNIEELEDLKNKYKLVDCEQFRSLLKSYSQYKAAVEKKKLIYASVNNSQS